MNTNHEEFSWPDWVSYNLARGCDPTDMYQRLLDGGYAPEDACRLLERTDQSANEGNCDVISHAEQISPSAAAVAQAQSIYLPMAVRLDTYKAEVYVLDDFLNEIECIRLIAEMHHGLRPSTVTSGCTEVRTSRTCDFEQATDPIVAEVDERICRYMGIPATSAENIQGQWYRPGEEFKPHTDYFEPETPTSAQHLDHQGQRTWTFMVYLNSTAEGGATDFPELGVKFKPKAGTAVIWSNHDNQGNLNPNTIHHGKPVVRGFKAILTKWFRSPTMPVQYYKEANELITPLTRTGFLKTAIPQRLHGRLVGYYNAKKGRAEIESVPEFISTESDKDASRLIQITDGLSREVHEATQPTLEAWVGDELIPSYVYGIREYLTGARLKTHRDRLHTHRVSAILNIAQDVSTDWPLTIEDHLYRQHSVTLQPGEMLLYEGTRLSHGRNEAFNGQTYANVFVHFATKGRAATA